MIVITINTVVNIAKVEVGGHTVDKNKIVSRYYKSLNNIKRLMKICDIMHVYYNTTSPMCIIRKYKEDISIFSILD